MCVGKTAVVAGGAGFVGSHMCDLLLANGVRVVCLDNMITGSERNVAHLADDERFTLTRTDVIEPVAVAGDVDYVLNLASPASPTDFDTLAIEIMRVGAWGTYHLLELAREKNAVYLQASTSEVYGDPLVMPQTEDYWGNVNPIGRRSVYDEAKRYGEALTMAYHRKYGLAVRLLRIFNTYGPRMRPDDGRAIPTFISQALRGEDVTVHGDGSQTRSICFVADEVDGIHRLLMSDETQPVNVGNPDTEVTMKRLAETIVQLAGSGSRIVYEPQPFEDDPKRRRPDITRAREILGWEPQTGLDEGLGRTIEFFRGAV
ncbi:SDR family oxidoreductase [Candidatus Poribacteria bacterium]|nr:SDR family oxidoreductase [Candidatus Poribacteria bacterium]MBT5532699.1 SDR family oxidoreductase [Candidatus Poribacteria bacterium]MBT5711429.1 SDR family oxidoreductase [Candidatus Poribacteria bacterium]MBT7805867.1 SDR family oxidoreductase [Candidatus Poribacteria bacterium]